VLSSLVDMLKLSVIVFVLSILTLVTLVATLWWVLPLMLTGNLLWILCLITVVPIVAAYNFAVCLFLDVALDW